MSLIIHVCLQTTIVGRDDSHLSPKLNSTSPFSFMIATFAMTPNRLHPQKLTTSDMTNLSPCRRIVLSIGKHCFVFRLCFERTFLNLQEIRTDVRKTLVPWSPIVYQNSLIANWLLNLNLILFLESN